MRSMVDWLHGENYSVGIYTALGQFTCNKGGRSANIPGSYGHYDLDAETLLIDFDVDAVKVGAHDDDHQCGA